MNRLYNYCFILLLSISFCSAAGLVNPDTTLNVNTYVGNLTNLSEMADVNIPSPSNDEVLTWDSATSKWIASTLSSIAKWVIDTANGFFYTSGNTLYFNDTLLNNTIDDRAVTTETDPIYTAQNSTIARIGDCPAGQVVANITTGGVECILGTGDITSVQGDDIYIYNGSNSGDVTLAFNETKLNSSVEAFGYITSYSETDPLWTANQSLYVPFTGAGSNLDLGVNNFLINNSVFFVNSTSGNVGVGTANPESRMEFVEENLSLNFAHHESTTIPFVTDTYNGIYGKWDDGSDSVEGYLARRYVFSPNPTGYYGLYGSATSTERNYGVYGYAAGGTTNWAGYFKGDLRVTDNVQIDDNVTINGRVGISTTTPQNKLNVIGDGNFTGTIYSNEQVVLTFYSETDPLWTANLTAHNTSWSTDTTYDNGTGLSLVGTTFSVVLSYFTDRFIELTDSFGGDVSGTYDAIVVSDDSHLHEYQNISNEPWIEDSELPLANKTTPYCGNITGATSNLCTLVDTDTDTTYSHLSNFTDDLGDRGYTHLGNFTNDLGIGNWSNDSSDYYNTTQADTEISNANTSMKTYVDGTFITQANEGNLDVNSSDYWDEYNIANSTWFQNIAGALSLNLSELTSWTDTWLGTKDTDDLSEGSTNLYDNQSWNESGANNIYVNIDGDNMTGNLNNTGNITADTFKGDLEVDYLSGSSNTTIQDYIDSTQSAGRISGGEFTDNGDGTITVAAGLGFIKTTNNEIGNTIFFEWAENTSVPLYNGSISKIFVDYNSGSPIIKRNGTLNHNTELSLGSAFLCSLTGDVHILTGGTPGYNLARLAHQRHREEGIERVSGAVIGEPSGLNISVTDGVFWAGLNRIPLGAFDSTSASNNFTYYYQNGTGGWYIQEEISVINNTYYDDGSGTLAELTVNRYAVGWVYEDNDGHIIVLYGQGDYVLGGANNANPPSPAPTIISEFSTLVGKVIVQKGAVNFTSVLSAFEVIFTPSAVTDYNDLSNLPDLTLYPLRDGTRELTDNWDVGLFNFTNTNAWWLGKVAWDTIQNKFITAVDNIYIDMVGTTATFNETKLNESIEVFGYITTDTNASTACSGSTTYLDGEGNCDDISGVYIDESALPLANLTTPYCGNITGATSNLCTLVDSDTTYTHLTNFTDNLGDRGYTSNLNFTNDAGYYNSSDFSISDYFTSSQIEGFNYWNDTFATFNKTYADTLYADISVTGDNSSWNETYAKTIFYDEESDLTALLDDNYADISVTDTNETIRFNTLVGTDCGLGNYSYGFDSTGLIQCREDEGITYTHLTNFTDDLGDRGYTSNLNFSNDASYYNSSDFSISDYFTKTNILSFNYWNNTYATFNKTYADTLYADISVTGDNSSWNETYADTLYRADSWDNLTGIPHATPSDGDTTHFSLADEIYDWVIAFGYATTTYVDNLVASVGNWSADKGDYSTTAEADVLYATIDEPLWTANLTAHNTSWSTDTTYTAGNGISVTSEVFSVAGNTALTQDADGLSVTANGITDTQLEYDTGQHLTTTSNPQFNNVTVTDCIIGGNGAELCFV